MMSKLSLRSLNTTEIDTNHTKDLILEYKQQAELIISKFDSKFRSFINGQQLNFEQIYNQQMVIIQKSFFELFEKIQNYTKKETENERFKYLASQRNFFHDQAIFLKQQNDILTQKIKKLKINYEVQKSETNNFKKLYLEFKNRELFLTNSKSASGFFKESKRNIKILNESMAQKSMI